jgi:serine protease AprX
VKLGNCNIDSHKLFLITLIIYCLPIQGQHGAKYWVQFTDKDKVSFSINDPEKFLSHSAILRRLKNNATITEEDLPVSKLYVDSLRKSNVKVMYTSKWFNSATIEVYNESDINRIKNFSFVKAVEKTADALNYKNFILSNKNKVELNELATINTSEYGNGFTQIQLENGLSLHEKGFRGKGTCIAIIDAGFHEAENYVSLDSVRIENRVLSTKNFVDIGESVYNSESHGAYVLSTIAANLPGTLIGTAPDAFLILLCSEDGRSEYPVEEDNWVAAAEFADSSGADIISTSLGYTTFNNSSYNHTIAELNGESTRISRAAAIASAKGIIVVVSAGNDGDNSWHYIGVPADAKNILTAGAIRSDSTRALFSSFGPSYDGRVKPDVMAMGQNVTVEGSIGQFFGVAGTSFSAPIIAGLTACLVQAYPKVKGADIMNAIRISSNNFNNPSYSFGYGIPDFNKAFNLLQDKIEKPDNSIWISPNPFRDILVFNTKFSNFGQIKIMCFNAIGDLIFETTKPVSNYIILQTEVQNLKHGLYIFKCFANNNSWVFKAIKMAN